MKEKLDDLELKLFQRALDLQNSLSEIKLCNENIRKQGKLEGVLKQNFKKIIDIKHPSNFDDIYTAVEQLLSNCQSEIIDGAKAIINIVNEEKDNRGSAQ